MKFLIALLIGIFAISCGAEQSDTRSGQDNKPLTKLATKLNTNSDDAEQATVTPHTDCNESESDEPEQAETPEPKPGDFNGDGWVDQLDIDIFSPSFLSSSDDPAYEARFDFDQDGDVDGQDYGRMGTYLDPRPGDLDGNGLVNAGDYQIFKGCFLTTAGEDGFREDCDLDGDGDVDGQDYGRFGLLVDFKPGDLNFDGWVDNLDYELFGHCFLRTQDQAGYRPDCDFDRDGDVDGQDYGRFGLSFDPRPGDFDSDGDVDQADYEVFQGCFLKSAGDDGYLLACDFDEDGDVDGQDYGRFGTYFTP